MTAFAQIWKRATLVSTIERLGFRPAQQFLLDQASKTPTNEWFSSLADSINTPATTHIQCTVYVRD